jgi:uncharacterized membrane protein SpoIIM required for sporulation
MEQSSKPWRTHKKYFIVSLIVYILSFGVGLVISKSINITISPDNSNGVLGIFGHNLFVGIKLMLFGWLTIGLMNNIYLAYNAVYLGIFIGSVTTKYGFTPILTGILPHSFFEIIALLLFSAIGSEVLRYLEIVKNNSKSDIRINYFKTLKSTFLTFILAIMLLIIAAFIEAYISYG